MSTLVSTLRLQDAWRECERNAYHLQRALGQLQPLLPLSGAQFQGLTDDPEKHAALVNIATEAARTMVGMLAAVEKKLRTEHPAVQLEGSVP